MGISGGCAGVDTGGYRYLSVAFDTIDHSILLNRLSNVFGITSSVKSWFRSYLTDRTCRVKVANVLSDMSDMSCEGSKCIIGP